MKIILQCRLTSTDAQEITALLREKEITAIVGDDLEVKTWICDDGHEIQFIVDQERARQKGLMK